VRVLQQQQKRLPSEISVIVANSKASDKQTDVAAANIKRAKALLDSANQISTYTAVTAAIDAYLLTFNWAIGVGGQSFYTMKRAVVPILKKRN
jgi:hypothetical protein